MDDAALAKLRRLLDDVVIALDVRSKVPGEEMVGRDVEHEPGNPTPLFEHEPGTWGRAAAARIAPAGGWHEPLPSKQP